MRKMLLKIFSSTVIRYLFIRYLAYGIQFANSILLLDFLKDYKYGIYSFCLMIISYVSYFNLGLNQSLNTILSVKKTKSNMAQNVWASVFSLSIVISLLLFVLNALLIFYSDSIFEKYEYHTYGVFVVFIGILINFNLVFVSLYRVYNKYEKINFNQIFPPFITLLIALLYRDNLALLWLFIFISIANLISLIVFMINTPLKNKLLFRWSIMKLCVIRGFNLMLYSFSFQYITIASITMVSIYFSPEDLGYFNLALSISNACVMLVSSILFMIYPKMLNRLSVNNSRYRLIYLIDLKKTYVVCVDFVLLSILICCVALVPFFPKYNSLLFVLKVSLVGQLLLNAINGVSTMIIADKKEGKLTIYGLISIFSVFVTSYIIKTFAANYYNMSYSILGGLFLYVLLLTNYSSKILNISFGKMILTLFTFYKFAIIAIVIFSCYYSSYFVLLFMLLLLVAYILKYRSRLLLAIKEVIFNNEVLKI